MLGFLIMFAIFSFLDYLIIKIQIKKNIDLFYALHRSEIVKSLKKEGEI